MAADSDVPTLKLEDIQSLILRRRPTPYVGCHVLLHFGGQGDTHGVVRDSPQGREFLRRLKPHIVSAARSESADTWVAVALTYTGLQALGVPQESLDSFPEAFKDGMAKRAPAFETCEGSWEPPYGTGQVHGWMTVLCGATNSSPDAMAAARKNFQDRINLAGQQLETLPRVKILARDDYEQTTGITPFGYQDGISFPDILGNEVQRGLKTSEPPIAAGEFVLGYPGEGGRSIKMPLLGTEGSLGRNGTFLGFRKLHSKVATFRRFLRDSAAAQGISPELLAAKMIGRWPSGAPLILAPDSDQPDIASDLQRLNNFSYASDAKGMVCPMGSHLRRMNPRDTKLQVMADVRLRRILRHGTAYGLPLPDGVLEDDGRSRGMFFIFMSATAPETYEFLKKDWLNDGNFIGLGRERDPIDGSHDGTGVFTIPAKPFAIKIPMPESFTQTLGGEYAFMPSLSALEWISELPGVPRNVNSAV